MNVHKHSQLQLFSLKDFQKHVQRETPYWDKKYIIDAGNTIFSIIIISFDNSFDGYHAGGNIKGHLRTTIRGRLLRVLKVVNALL